MTKSKYPRQTIATSLFAIVIILLCEDFSALNAQSVSDDIGLRSTTSYYGDYGYRTQDNLYSEITIGETLDDFSSIYTVANAKISDMNRFIGWGTSRKSSEINWDLGMGLRPMIAGGVTGQFGSINDRNDTLDLDVQLGFLHLDNFGLSYGAIYTDIEGDAPGVLADDGWAQIVWLHFRASFIVGDSISVSFHPILYWLPNNGEVGWGFPAPYAGMALPPTLQSSSLAQVAWAKQFGSWRLSVYDQFNPFMPAYNFWDAAFNLHSHGWYDLSPIDKAGRYALGYGLQDPGNYRYNTESRLGTKSDYSSFLGAYNLVGGKALKQWNEKTSSLLYFDRIDLWDADFSDIIASIAGGLVVQMGGSKSRLYGGYNFVSAHPHKLFIHSVAFGVSEALSNYLSVFAEAGGFWYSGDRDDRGWLAQAGFNQQISQLVYNSFQVGRRVYHPGLQEPGVEDFAEYRLFSRVGLRSELMVFCGLSERHIDTTGPENDNVYKFAGAQITTQFGPRTMSFVRSGWESVELESSSFSIDRWLHRLGVMSHISNSVTSQCFYQYETVSGTQNFTEHLLYLGVTKSF